MPQNTCFVIMPIGNQSYGQVELSSVDLKQRYDDLIRVALLAARPDLEITRADEVAASGTVTNDILTRLMHSDFVVADVSFPNPNVFYELGLRHACRAGTIIIRDAKTPKPPFDIAHLRHIEYQNTPTGLKELASSFRQYFDQASIDSARPDNHFLELAKLTQYQFPDFGVKEETVPPEMEMLMTVMESPELLDLFLGVKPGEPIEPAKLLQALAAKPAVAKQLLGTLVKTGHLKFPLPAPSADRPEKVERESSE